ncbi:hypothetical protein FRC09_011293 [Ceratobasidium sp. 395]|nr:hypothetical protein FRC09_011293 [Ceratobasidium sp. 395]
MAEPLSLNLLCAACDSQMGPLPPAASLGMYLVGCGHVVCKACADCSQFDLAKNENNPPRIVHCRRCVDDVPHSPCTRLFLSAVRFTTGGDTPAMALLRAEEARLSAEAARLCQQLSTEVAVYFAAKDRVKDLREMMSPSGSLKRRRVNGAE